jgi:hypothetical protein
MGGVDRAHESIREWLCGHADSANAQQVYGAWLAAGREGDLIHEPANNWHQAELPLSLTST